MAISRRSVLVGAGAGIGVAAVGGTAAVVDYTAEPTVPGSHVVGSLPADDKTPGWYHTSRKRTPTAPLAGDAAAPFVVIGAGVMGLAAARRIALNFPDDQVILIEAQEVGFGSSGRNAGFAIDLPHDIGAPDYIGDLTIAQKILKLNLFGQSTLKDLVDEHGIDCHMRRVGKYQAAISDHGMAVLDAYSGGLTKLGQKFEVIEGKDLPDHIGTSYYRRALHTPNTMLLQPSALMKGLADSLPANVSLYEGTAITAVDYGPRTTLHHANGIITADKLILANNAFGQQFGLLRNHSLLPMFTFGSLTRPLTADEQASIGGQDFWGVIPADTFGTTLRRTHDNRILVRNSFNFIGDGRAKPELLKEHVKTHRASFEARFPTLTAVDFEYTWGGALGMARNGASYFGELGPNVYGVLGCNGLGLTRGTAMGTLLGDWLAGKSSDLTEFMLTSPRPVTNPPEPFLSIGVNYTLRKGMSNAGPEI